MARAGKMSERRGQCSGQAQTKYMEARDRSVSIRKKVISHGVGSTYVESRSMGGVEE